MRFLGVLLVGPALLLGLLALAPLAVAVTVYVVVIFAGTLLLRRKRRYGRGWRLRRLQDLLYWNESRGKWQARAATNAFPALLLGALLLSPLGPIACQPMPTAPGPITVCGGTGSCGGNVGQASPSPSPSPTPLPGCQSIARVDVGFKGGGGRTETKVGAGEVLDVTPRYGDRSEAPAHCHGATVQWSLAGTARCELTGDTSGFTPNVTCSTAGTFTATATVAPPGGTGSATFTVTQ